MVEGGGVRGAAAGLRILLQRQKQRAVRRQARKGEQAMATII